MAEINNERLEEQGKKVLGGVTVLFWVVSILTGIGMFSLNFSNWMPKDLIWDHYPSAFPHLILHGYHLLYLLPHLWVCM